MSRSVSSAARRRSSTPKKGKAGVLVPEDARAYRALAASWLRYIRGCSLICFERSPWGVKELPDALGLDKYRRLIEIEIKVSKSDFLHDAEKPHRRNLLSRITGKITTAPQELWYLVPRRLLSVVLENAPEYAGVLVPSDTEYDSYSGMPTLEVHRQALRLHSYKLPIPQTLDMAKDMAGTLVSVLRDYINIVGEVTESALVRGFQQHPMDAPSSRQMKLIPASVPFVNPTQTLPISQETASHDGVRKSWANIGRQGSGRPRSTPGETRSPG